MVRPSRPHPGRSNFGAATAAALTLAVGAGCGGRTTAGTSVDNPHIVSISAGGNQSCAVWSDGSLYCWGGDVVFAGVPPDDPRRATPRRVDIGTERVERVWCGAAVTCVRRGGGRLACWGRNDYGEVGVPPAGVDVATPQPVPVDAPAVVSAGLDHTCAVAADGTTFCWGENMGGQLGRPADGDPHPVPAVVPNLPRVLTLSVFRFTAAVAPDGRVWVWPWGTRDAAGNPVLGPTPVVAPGIVDAIDVAVGMGHACVGRRNARVACWGPGADGLLGDGTQLDRWLPVEPVGLGDVAEVGAGESHTCARRADGTVACWGFNHSGNVGSIDDIGAGVVVPRGVPGVRDTVALAVGSAHACALGADGAVTCWGANHAGQVGDGSVGTYRAPTRVRFPDR